MTLDVTEQDMLIVGLRFIGYDATKTNNARAVTNLDRFQSAYGASPLVCTLVFHDVQVQEIGEATIHKPNLKNFLMAMHWLKRYPVETMMSSIFNLHEETIRNRVIEYVGAIQALKMYKVSFYNFNNPFLLYVYSQLMCIVAFKQIVWQDNVAANNNQQVGVALWLLSVDGTHCRIKEPRSVPDKDWYSHKHHKPCLAYELGVNLFESKLVWINGPFKAGETDLVIFRKPDGLRTKIPPNRMIIGDRGYVGEESISTPNGFDSEVVNQFKRRARARHEDFNGRIKTFAVLSERFRHSVDKHKAVFEAVCVVTQYSMENGHPLFEI
jgi:DDE superfamily endonuclease